MPEFLPKALALLPLLSAATLHADWSGAISLSNRYPWRGFVKDEGLVVHGALDYESPGGWFAGAVLSTIDFGASRYAAAGNGELALYAGRAWQLGADWRADIQLDQYFYDDDLFGRSADYREVRARWHFRDLLSLEFDLAPDAYDSGESMLNCQLGARYPLGPALELSAGIGYFDAAGVLGSDTRHGYLGLGWYHRHGAVELRYVMASRTDTRTRYRAEDYAGEYTLDDALVLSLSLGF